MPLSFRFPPWPRHVRRSLPGALVVVVSACLIGSTVGMVYYQLNRAAHLAEAGQQLKKLTALRVQEVAQWRTTQMGSAKAVANMVLFLDPPTATEGPGWGTHHAGLVQWLQRFATLNAYTDAFLLDRRGGLDYGQSTAGAPDLPDWHEAWRVAGRQSDPVELPLALRSGGSLGGGFLVPLRVAARAPLLGGVLLSYDYSARFQEEVQRWNVETPDTRTDLWWLDGVLLRNLGNPALTHPLPLRPASGPSLATRVAGGERSVVEATDHQGRAVLGCGRTVPGSSWFVLATVEVATCLAPLREDSLWFARGAFSLTIIACLVAALILRRRQAVANLEKAQLAERLSLVLRHANDAVFIFGDDFIVTEMNQRAEEFYGYTREELVGHSILPLRAGGHGSVAEAMAQARATGGLAYEAVNQRKDGSTFPVEVSLSLVTLAGRECFLSLVRDSTERVHAARKLTAQHARFQTIFEQAPVGIAIHSMEGVLVNPAHVRITGVSAADSCDVEAFARASHPDDVGSKLELSEAFRAGKVDFFQMDKRYRREGGWTWARMSSHRVLDPGTGGPMTITTLVDLTSIKALEAEMAIRESEQRRLAELLAEAQSVGEVGSWEIDVFTGAVAWSQQAHRVFGTDPGTFRPNRDMFRTLVPTDDRPALVAVWEESLTDFRRHETEHRIVAPDGQNRIVREQWQAFANEAGQVRRVVGTCQDITSRRIMEKNYRILFDQAFVGVAQVDSTNGRFLLVNQRYSDITGYTAVELVALRWQDITHPDDLVPNEAQCRQIVRGEIQSFVTEKRYIRKDGTVVTVELAVTASMAVEEHRYHTAVIQDITALVAARERARTFAADLEQQVQRRTAELQVRNRENAALLESIPDMIMRVQSDGIIVHCPSARSPDMLAAIPCSGTNCQQSACLRNGLREAFMAAGTRALASSVMQVSEVTLQTTPVVTVEVRAAPVSGMDQFVVFVRDISARRRRDDDLARALARERELSEMKTRFIAVTSHEFRTPMAAALTSLELLANHSDTLSPARRQSVLHRVAVSLHRMSSMLDDLLTLNQVAAGKATVTFTRVDLRQIVENLMEEMRLASEGSHRFDLQSTGDCSGVISDNGHLWQILTVLLDNAQRYSPPGSLITIRLAGRADGFTVVVEDHGIGIPLADQERVFEPFERGSNTTGIEGSGLGLSIARGLIRLLGGRLTLASSADGGTIFTVDFPLQRLRPKQVAPVPAALPA